MIAYKLSPRIALTGPAPIDSVDPALVECRAVSSINGPPAMTQKDAYLPESCKEENQECGGDGCVHVRPEQNRKNENHNAGCAGCDRPFAAPAGRCGDGFKILLACRVFLAHGACGVSV